MKEIFFKFQLPKEKMNEVRGGNTQRCHCGGSSNEFLINGTGGSFDELEDVVGKICGDAGWACTPVK